MRRNVTLLAFLLSIAVAATGQDRTLWRTAADIVEGVRGSVVGTVVETNESRGEAVLEVDDNARQRVTVLTDSVSTQYNGFGGVINGAPEIYTGSKGFPNVRVGDRLDIRGTGRAGGTVMADHVTLLGRSVAATQVGVGETRPPTTVSTPTASQTTTTVFGGVEGVIRQINAADNRIVVETDRREILTVRTTATTPVYFRGATYQVRNLEIGDRIRVETDGPSGTRDVRARSIDVVQSVQDTGRSDTRRVSSISGRVSRVDRSADMIRVNTGRAEVRVDMIRAVDAAGRTIHAADLQIGDRVVVSGSYGSNSDLFVASTVRLGAGTPLEPAEPDIDEDEDEDDDEDDEFVTVSVAGTITESLQTSPTLEIRDRIGGRILSVHVTEDFVYRTKAGTFATADRLNIGDSVLIKAFRDEGGNLIAQTIRIR